MSKIVHIVVTFLRLDVHHQSSSTCSLLMLDSSEGVKAFGQLCTHGVMLVMGTFVFFKCSKGFQKPFWDMVDTLLQALYGLCKSVCMHPNHTVHCYSGHQTSKRLIVALGFLLFIHDGIHLKILTCIVSVSIQTCINNPDVNNSINPVSTWSLFLSF